MQLATCILQHATCTSHPSISNYTLQPVTCNFNLKHKVCSPRLQMCKLKQHWGLHHHFWCMISHHHHHHHHHQVEHAPYSMTCSIFLCLPLQLIVIHVCILCHPSFGQCGSFLGVLSADFHVLAFRVIHPLQVRLYCANNALRISSCVAVAIYWFSGCGRRARGLFYKPLFHKLN